MTASYWLKLWLDIMDDPKVARWPDWLFRRWIMFLCAAKDYDKQGYLQPVSDLAYRLRLEERQVEEALQAFSEVGVVRKDAQGWLIVNFAKRQGAAPGAERVRRHRQAHPKTSDAPKPNVTKRYIEQSRTEAESEERERDAPGLLEELQSITGIMATPADIQVVIDLEKAGATIEDGRAALDWWRSEGKVLSNIRSLKGAIEYQIRKRIQAANARPPKNGNARRPSLPAAPIPEPLPGSETWKFNQEIANASD